MPFPAADRVPGGCVSRVSRRTLVRSAAWLSALPPAAGAGRGSLLFLGTAAAPPPPDLVRRSEAAPPPESPHCRSSLVTDRQPEPGGRFWQAVHWSLSCPTHRPSPPGPAS